jgi:hypothetical protein
VISPYTRVAGHSRQLQPEPIRELYRQRNIANPDHHIGDMNLELSDEESAALERELRHIIDDDRYPLSPRIMTLKAILAKMRPMPERQPLPPLYEPPKAVMRKRRRG